MKFSTRLLLCVLVPSLVFASAGLLGTVGMGVSLSRLDAYFDREKVLADDMQEMYSQGLQMGQALRNIILDPANRQAYDNLEAARKGFAAAHKSAAATAADPALSSTLERIHDLQERQSALQAEIVALAKVDSAAARTKLNADETPLWRQIRSQLLEQIKVRRVQAEATRESALALGERVRLAAGVLMALAAAAAVGFFIAARRCLHRELGCDLAEARQVLDAVSAGDLTRPVVVPTGAEKSLLAALAGTQSALTHLVDSVRGNAESVASASSQISQGNNDLSGRTEEQASALEQTSASMKQLAATVQQNAASAEQGNVLASDASNVAARGGEVVGQVVETMKGINESSRKISDIIGVIDGIAFQTNILALNAAVEAARAGEQGRGFAVVAGEVRTLAQRSADAAKEIKGLIGDSVQRVEQGSALVDQAGTTMGEVVASIREVSDIMAKISRASTEQSAGVAQIGEAVTQMDQATQQNAALVEQSAAAAESLKAQAQQLVSAVAVFRVGDNAASFAQAA